GARPFGVVDKPTIERRAHAVHNDLAALDGDRDAFGGVTAHIQADGDADALTGWRSSGVPTEVGCRGFEDGAVARLGEVTQAELDRVHADGGRDFVDVAFS